MNDQKHEALYLSPSPNRKRLLKYSTQVISQQQYVVHQEDERTKHKKQMEEQMKVALDKVKVKVDFRQKIRGLLQKASQKFKLNSNTDRFDKKFFKELKGLNTFVDVNKQIKSLNCFNDQSTLRKLDYIKKNNKVQIRNRVGDDLIVQHFQEDEDEQQMYPTKEQMENDGYMTIDLIKEATQQKTDYKKAYTDRVQKNNCKNLIFKSQKLIDTMSTSKDKEFNQKMDKYIEGINTDRQATERSVEDRFTSKQNRNKTDEYYVHNRKISKLEQEETSQAKSNVAVDLVKQLKRQYGIEFDSKRFQLQDVHKKYMEKSQRLLKFVRQDSINKFNIFQKDQNQDQKINEELKIPQKQRLILRNDPSQDQTQSQWLKQSIHLIGDTEGSYNQCDTPKSPHIMTQTKTPQLIPKPVNKKLIMISKFGGNMKQILQPLSKNNQCVSSIQVSSPKKKQIIGIETNMTRFIARIQDTEREFLTDRQSDRIKIEELSNDLNMIWDKHDMSKKYSTMGFNFQDSNMDQRRQVVFSKSSPIDSQETRSPRRFNFS